jgi:[ribosomal protein S18]-alanine N-acetyltransferase
MTRTFSIRLLRLSDLDRILQIEHASFGKDAYDRNLFADLTRKCGELFLVAAISGRVCGYMVTCIGERHQSTTVKPASGGAELVSIAVDPKHRGKGVASALMDSTLRRLRRRGVVQFHLMVKGTNKAAIGFYMGYGFHKLRTVRGYYEDGADGWLMAKFWTSQST